MSQMTSAPQQRQTNVFDCQMAEAGFEPRFECVNTVYLSEVNMHNPLFGKDIQYAYLF